MTPMQELGLTPAQARAAHGAMRVVVEADGPAGAEGTRLLDSAAQALELGPTWRAQRPCSHVEIAGAFPAPVARRALVDSLLVAACIEGEVTVGGEAAVRALADLLDVRSHWVDLLPAMRRRSVLQVKRALATRSPDARRIFARTWAEEGLLGGWRVVLFVLGLARDAKLAARFRALRDLPEGTFGRRVFDDLDGRGFAFPGEKGGLPERMMHHDLMHVVNGYGTDPAGECELAGFYTGFCARHGDPHAFTFIVTVLATFQLGMAVSPAIVTPARGAFDPERVLAAYLRGRRLSVDVMGPWDYWSLFPLSTTDAQQRLGIGPSR